VLARAVAWEWIDRSPLTSVRDPRDLTSRPPRWYSVGELQAIYAAPLSAAAAAGCELPKMRMLHQALRFLDAG